MPATSERDACDARERFSNGNRRRAFDKRPMNHHHHHHHHHHRFHLFCFPVGLRRIDVVVAVAVADVVVVAVVAVAVAGLGGVVAVAVVAVDHVVVVVVAVVGCCCWSPEPFFLSLVLPLNEVRNKRRAIRIESSACRIYERTRRKKKCLPKKK